MADDEQPPEESGECSNGEYVTGFSGQEDDKIQAAFMIPASQHYDITVSVRTKVPGSDKILLNGEEIVGCRIHFKETVGSRISGDFFAVDGVNKG